MKRETMIKTIGVFVALYLFLVGIKGMGASFKLMGEGFAEALLISTSNPLTALFIGILATTLVQSSSTTTSIIVGLVAAGGISVSGAVPMVMGANIGTTVTNTIVAIGHIRHGQEFRRAFAASTVHDFFNLIAVLILFPIEYFTGILSKSAIVIANLFDSVGGLKLANPLKTIIDPAVHLLQQLVFDNPIVFLIVSILLTFLMLWSIVKILRSLVLEKVEVFFDKYIFKTGIRAMTFGMILTVFVQSSSVTTSIVIPLVGAGVLRLMQVYPYTLGSNIGTTVTAMLAALSTGNIHAVTVSFAHLFFNIFGILIIYPMPGLKKIPPMLAKSAAKFAQQNKIIPISYIIFLFYLLPLIVIFLGR
ncbi:MAG: Na/Pi symporter [Candidatus Marinimicrobia bacterium]|nr:Na/Pi symporter [Candidatus Neomarinimicrobiota bacterium]